MALANQLNKTPYPGTIWHRSPERVGFQTEYGLWADRMWEPGERAEYCRAVLQREPYAGES